MAAHRLLATYLRKQVSKQASRQIGRQANRVKHKRLVFPRGGQEMKSELTRRRRTYQTAGLLHPARVWRLATVPTCRYSVYTPYQDLPGSLALWPCSLP